MNGIIINGKTYVAVNRTNCDDCCFNSDNCNSICSCLYFMIEDINSIMFKELKTEENTKNIDNIK